MEKYIILLAISLLIYHPAIKEDNSNLESKNLMTAYSNFCIDNQLSDRYNNSKILLTQNEN